MANSRYDLAVIGSGPGGYVAAIRASQLKMRAAVIERDQPGGVCLNWGCIPSKALLNSAETIETIRGAAREHGIEVGEVKLDFKRVIARSREAADKLSKGVRFLLRKNKVDLLEANATIAGPHTVALGPASGKPAPQAEAIEAERILIATGSGEKLFPGMTLGNGVMTSKEALIHDRLPQSIVIIGAGAIGLEQIDFVLAQEKANALGKFVGGLAAASDHSFEVQLHFADFDTVLARGAPNRFHRLRGIEQRLGRNTSPIEAYSAGLVALDDGGAHLELARPDRTDVSARAGTDYCKVVA